MLNKTYFIIPQVNNINFLFSKGNRERILKTLGYDPILNITKNKISSMSYSKWSKLRKHFNDFEFPIDYSKISRPISRAYFKLLEILVDFNIDIDGDTLHLAEAPGGFIEATRYLKLKKGISIDSYYTFSVLGDDKIPIYNKNLISDVNVKVLSNKKNRGDLYSVDNIKELIKLLERKNISFISCDGGFAENSDFSSKEQLHHHLIFNEIVTSLFILKNGGSFVVKVFDIFTELTFDYIYLLSYLFSEVYICKPNTSRPTNSEKYIVCKRYNKKRFDQHIQNSLKILCSTGIESYSSFVNKTGVQQEVLSSIREINTYFLKYQVYNINNIIEIDYLDLKVSKCQKNAEDWVKKYY